MPKSKCFCRNMYFHYQQIAYISEVFLVKDQSETVCSSYPMIDKKVFKETIIVHSYQTL